MHKSTVFSTPTPYDFAIRPIQDTGFHCDKGGGVQENKNLNDLTNVFNALFDFLKTTLCTFGSHKSILVQHKRVFKSMYSFNIAKNDENARKWGILEFAWGATTPV